MTKDGMSFECADERFVKSEKPLLSSRIVILKEL